MSYNCIIKFSQPLHVNWTESEAIFCCSSISLLFCFGWIRFVVALSHYLEVVHVAYLLESGHGMILCCLKLEIGTIYYCRAKWSVEFTKTTRWGLLYSYRLKLAIFLPDTEWVMDCTLGSLNYACWYKGIKLTIFVTNWLLKWTLKINEFSCYKIILFF